MEMKNNSFKRFVDIYSESDIVSLLDEFEQLGKHIREVQEIFEKKVERS